MKGKALPVREARAFNDRRCASSILTLGSRCRQSGVLARSVRNSERLARTASTDPAGRNLPLDFRVKRLKRDLIIGAVKRAE
jgi:hypothetical protein